MNNNKAVNRPGWTLIEAILILLAITVIQLGTTSLGFKHTNEVYSFFGSGLLDVILYMGIIYLYVKHKSGDGWTALGLRPVNLFTSVIRGVGTGLLITGIVLVTGYVIAMIQGGQTQIQPVQQVGRGVSTTAQMLLFTLTATVLLPLKEEIVFRAFLFPALRERAGIFWGIILSSLLFSLSHGDLVRLIPLFIAGILLNILYYRTRSLYAAVAAHGVWNGSMSLIMFLGMSMN